jgi:predicted metal-binding protein
MMDRVLLEEQLSQLPLYVYLDIDPQKIEFSQRIRWICQNECPMYGKSWACPPGVGEVEQCRAKCQSYEKCLLIGTITETEDIASMEDSLKTRPAHEKVTNQVRDLMQEQGVQPYILSTEACEVCARCAILDGLPCRMPDRMHPCVESHGINLIPTLEENGLDFQYGGNIITWYSLLFYND